MRMLRLEQRCSIALWGEKIKDKKTHFHTRCQPKDMKSFMRSYVSATLLNTSATRCVFSASVTVWKPKCVSWSGRLGCGCTCEPLLVVVDDVLVCGVMPAVGMFRAALVVEKSAAAGDADADGVIILSERRHRAPARRIFRGADMVQREDKTF